MAKITSGSVSVIVVFCIAVTALLGPVATRGDRQERLRIYLHDTTLHKNASLDTDNPSVPRSARMSNPGNQFGAIYVVDDPLTSEPAMSSPHIGSAQGLYAYTGRTNGSVSAFWAFTTFLHGRGSLSIMGAEILVGSTEPRILNVVGGTGDFALARGTAALSTVAFTFPTYFVLSLDIALLLP